MCAAMLLHITLVFLLCTSCVMGTTPVQVLNGWDSPSCMFDVNPSPVSNSVKQLSNSGNTGWCMLQFGSKDVITQLLAAKTSTGSIAVLPVGLVYTDDTGKNTTILSNDTTVMSYTFGNTTSTFDYGCVLIPSNCSTTYYDITQFSSSLSGKTVQFNVCPLSACASRIVYAASYNNYITCKPSDISYHNAGTLMRTNLRNYTYDNNGISQAVRNIDASAVDKAISSAACDNTNFLLSAAEQVITSPGLGNGTAPITVGDSVQYCLCGGTELFSIGVITEWQVVRGGQFDNCCAHCNAVASNCPDCCSSTSRSNCCPVASYCYPYCSNYDLDKCTNSAFSDSILIYGEEFGCDTNSGGNDVPPSKCSDPCRPECNGGSINCSADNTCPGCPCDGIGSNFGCK